MKLSSRHWEGYLEVKKVWLCTKYAKKPNVDVGVVDSKQN